MSVPPVKPPAPLRAADAAAGSAVRRSPHFSLWLSVLLGVLVYVPSLRNGFTYDDVPLVAENPRLRQLTNVRAIWLSNWWEATGESIDANVARDPLYRPLTLCSLAVNYAVHDLRPVGYHLVNILLHGLACALVWLLARRLVDDPAVVAVATLLFAVHPIHVEAVANIIGRAEVLATVFLLAGLLVLLPADGRPGLGRVAGATALFVAGLLAKETAISYVPIALLALYLVSQAPRPPLRWWLVRAAVLLLPLIAYFPVRYVALGGRLFRTTPGGVTLNPLVLASPGQRVVGALEVLGHYTRLMLLPDRLSYDYGLAVIDPQAGFTPMAGLGLVAALGLGAGVVLAVRRWRRPPLAAGLVLLLLASYALISNSLLLIGVAVGERLFYWSSVFALLLLALGIVRVWQTQCRPGGRLAGSARLLGTLGVLLLIGLGARSTVRVLDWRDNLTLASRDVLTYPQSAQINKNYGVALIQWALLAVDAHDRDTLLTKAVEYLDAALKINPAYSDALAMRAYAAVLQNDTDRAWQFVESALRLDPFNAYARTVIANLRGELSERRLAALRDDVTTRPTDVELRRKLAATLLQNGEPRAARAELEQVLQLAPENTEALRLLGETLAVLGQAPDARAVFERVLAQTPDDWRVHSNLAVLLAPSDPAGALRHAERARALQPNELSTAVNLAEAYAVNRRNGDAVALYRQILHALDEDDPYRNVVTARITELERPGRRS